MTPRRNSERNACIKANFRVPGDERVRAEPWIFRRIINNQRTILGQCNVAKRHATFGFANIHTDRGLEPLSIAVYKRDYPNRHTKDFTCKLN
jgi:hypothetical protein